jgi:soluble lytic murein transglycosylase-like protein
MPAAFPMPATEEGTHLSYSLQWFAFGILMFVGFGYAARQQARNAAIDAQDALEAEEAGLEPMHSTAAAQRRRAPALRRGGKPTAEEEEDAILDAQGF